MLLSFFYIILILAAVGFGVWLLTTYVPMSPGFAKAIKIFAIVVCVLVLIYWVICAIGPGDVPLFPHHR